VECGDRWAIANARERARWKMERRRNVVADVLESSWCRAGLGRRLAPRWTPADSATLL